MTTHRSNKKITVLSGGPSAEREVSLSTGKAIQAALEELGHTVTMVDPDHTLFTVLKNNQPDLVFNALHGTFGEDGVIQGCLEWLNLPYTGSKLKASAMAMDKALSRTLFKSVNVPVAEGIVWNYNTPLPSVNQVPAGGLIVKPTNEGSSVGLDQVNSYEELCHILKAKTEHGPQEWLIESYLEGQEVSVVVFDDEVWGSVEIEPSVGLYDYEAKYTRGDTTYHCPPRISHTTLTRLETYALKAYKILSCSGVARIDFITNEQQDITLELNTLPGMTSTSLVPKVAAERGISFVRLVELIIESALKG